MLTIGTVFTKWKAITPSDTADLDVPIAGIYVGGAGDVTAIMRDGTAGVFKAATVGLILPIAPRRINATGTTATNLLALQE